jgi:predicted transcriptional regulator
MEVHLTPDLTAKLNALASATGRAPEELAADAIAGYIDGLAEVRAELDRRYDDFKSGKVKPVDGEEAFARLRAKSAARRANGPSRQLTAP